MKRRDFLKISGAGALALACAPKQRPVEEPAQMQYRTNPNNGDKTSLIGYGCMRWPMVKGEDGKDRIDQEAVNEMVAYAMDHGINYYDTSPVYLQGQSEIATGEALKPYPRESYYLATKLSNFGDTSPEGSRRMFEESLKNLHTDYIDYYLLHALGSSGRRSYQARYVDNGIVPWLLEQKRLGRIRNIGFSFHGPQENFDALMALHDSGEMHWDFVMIEMNYVDWNHAEAPRNTNASYLYAELDRREIPVMVMEPLLGGRLAKVPADIADRMKQREPDKSVASWAFRFVGSHPRIQCLLSGMASMDPLIENCETFSHFQPLTPEEMDFLEEMARRMKEYPLVGCTDCKYCMPCPWGIDIPGIFQHYNHCVTEGTYAQSAEQKRYHQLKKAYLTSYDKAVPTVRQADHCIGCGSCLPHCPQSIPIPTELRRIATYIEKLKQDRL